MITFTDLDRVLIVAPHPDDESLATGGLIQRACAAGAAVRVVFATSGDRNPWPQRFLERRWGVSLADRVRWAARRRAEASQALALLSDGAASARFLDLPDQGLTRLLMQGGRSVALHLARELAEWHPTLIVGPSRDDSHPDHSALHLLLKMALEPAGAEAVQSLDYVVHVGRSTRNASPLVLELEPAETARKLEAIHCHATQTALSRKRFCAYAGPEERYYRCTSPPDPDHPITLVDLDQRTLRLTAKTSRFQLCPQRVLLALETASGQALRWSITLPAFSGFANVRNARDHRRLCPAEVRISRSQATLQIPISGFPRIERVFSKLAISHWFYGSYGWCELFPLIVRARPTSQAAALSRRSAPQIGVLTKIGTGTSPLDAVPEISCTRPVIA